MRRVLFAMLTCAACGSSSGGGAAPGDDAGVDAPPPPAGDDGGPPSEGGGADAADANVDAGSRFCASLSPAPRFCDDFDDVDPMTKKWDQQTYLPGISALSIDETQFTSAPASLLVTTMARPAGEGSVGSLRKTVNGTPLRAKLVFSMRASATTWTQGAYSVANIDASNDHFYTLYFRDDDFANGQKASLKETVGSTDTYHPLSKVPPPNVWTRITVELDAEAGKATVLYGAETVLDATIASFTMSDPTFRVGSPYMIGPTDAWNVNDDDVVFDF